MNLVDSVLKRSQALLRNAFKCLEMINKLFIDIVRQVISSASLEVTFESLVGPWRPTGDTYLYANAKTIRIRPQISTSKLPVVKSFPQWQRAFQDWWRLLVGAAIENRALNRTLF